MITFKTGNLLDAKTQAIVNTVNTVGVMGKGIALQMKTAFPQNTKAYTRAVKEGRIKIGEVLVVPVKSLQGIEYVINFPTKGHWRFPSQLSWVKEGLQDLRHKLLHYGIISVALPPLGCGNGGLKWEEVRLEIEVALGDLPIDVIVYEPSARIQAILKEEEKKGAAKLTPARAMLLQLLYRYRALGEYASEFAAEKLGYFLQRFGENQLKLAFQKGVYGPYSGKIRHVLFALNGYYLKGYEQKEAKPFEALELMVDKAPEVKQYLEMYLSQEDKSRLENISQFINGFETPYGLELLATVDFIAQENSSYQLDKIKKSLSAWSKRKSGLFTDRHLQLAVDHLKAYQAEIRSTIME